jgi:alpha/beta superfamily hydrolase
MSIAAEHAVVIPGPAGDLQAMWGAGAAGEERVAVVCHPHPLHGGSMDNKVVTTLQRTWRDAGVATLRFNFRGTGASAGVHDEGRGEIDDLLAVVAWLRDVQHRHRLQLAGFSFGAWVAAASAARLPGDVRLERLVLVAPPVQYEGFAALAAPAGTLVIQGEADDVVDPLAVRAWVASRPTPPELLPFPEAGHFFHGRLTELRSALATRL